MKRPGIDQAVFFLFLALVVGGIVVLIDPPPAPPPALAPGLLAIEASRDLRALRAEDRFHLSVRTDRALHLSVWAFDSGGARRLFPPLSLPPGQPWPLPPNDEEGWRIPFGMQSFNFPHSGKGHLVVFSRDDATPRPRAEIIAAADEKSRESLLREFGQHFLRYEVKP
jgi:hypothetical protein